MFLDLLKPAQHLANLFRGIGHRIQPDHRVACAEAEPLQHRRGDPLGIVGGVVGLQAAGKGAGKADGGVALGGDGKLLCGIDEV